MEQEKDIFIVRLRQRNRTACQQLMNEYGPTVFQLVRRIVGCQEDAEEVYQDVFLKALQAIDRYDHRATLLGWLRRIAYHEALNFIRRRRPAIVYMDDQDPALNNMDDTPEEDIHDTETVQALERALALLPAYERTIITMFYYDDMSLADIAYVTSSNPSTIGSQLSRIRKKLYRIIKTEKHERK